MECLNRFNRRMNIGGSSLRNENIFNSRMMLEATFDSDASFTDGVYFWELGCLDKADYDGKETVPIRMYGRTFSNANGSVSKFMTKIDTEVVVGDILYTSLEDSFWICTEVFNIDGIHYQGKLTQCNWILKWQNSKGEILEYPCQDINSTQYNSGEQSNVNFTIGSSQHMVTLPSDENTIAMNSPIRVYLDKNMDKPTVYRVTQNDSTSYNYGKKGLTKVTFLEDVENPAADRPDLGICDYIDVGNTPTIEPVVPTTTSSISYKSNTIKSGGSAKTFTAHFFDENNVEINTIVPKWDIVCGFTNHLKVVEAGNSIKISIDNDDFIDETFVLTLSDDNGDYTSSITVGITSIL